MEAVMKKAAVSVVLAALGGWLLAYSWQQREVALELFTPAPEAADRLHAFPEVQNQAAFQEWFQGRPDSAVRLFRRALAGNFLLVDAWLKLGEIEAARGNTETARAILVFTDRLTRGAKRWKWQQAMLALDLGLRDLFIRSINELIPQPRYRQNALFVLDQDYENHADAVGDALTPENLPHYLSWLMQGNRVEDARIVWEKMPLAQKQDPDMHGRYVHFLLTHRRVAEAKAAWKKSGLTHPGFEEEVTQRGFDWRWHNPKDESWTVKRAFFPDPNRVHAVQITFAGQHNLNFHHLYQIFPVEPGTAYTLRFEWRSRGLSTDQRPFVEIYGYDCKGLYAKGPMAPEDTDWRIVEIPFTVPETCEAAVVRLRRIKSHRFDSKIEGRLWVDNFGISDK